jgi:hypothetical protein
MSLAATELPSGFWSYVHKDNDAELGRILRLCDLITEEFGLLTGRDLELFVDRTGVAWGDKWRATIDDALTETTFFIAVVTPRYAASKECRRELIVFSQNAKARGVPELLFPIIYAEVDGLDEHSPDEVKAAIAQTQYEKFTELRLLDESDSQYRNAVNRMARRLVEIANTVAERADELIERAPTGTSSEPEDDDAPGLIEAMSAVEELLPEWKAIISNFEALLKRIGEVTSDYTPRMQVAATKGTAAQIVVADQYAKAIQPVAEQFRDMGLVYVSKTLEVSQNVIAIFDVLSAQSSDGTLGPDAEEFLRSMLELVKSGQSASLQVESFQESVRGTSRMSRAVRKPLKIVNEGAQQFLDAQALLNDWERRIAEILGEED